jgi:hypothetical protein
MQRRFYWAELLPFKLSSLVMWIVLILTGIFAAQNIAIVAGGAHATSKVSTLDLRLSELFMAAIIILAYALVVREAPSWPRRLYVVLIALANALIVFEVFTIPPNQPTKVSYDMGSILINLGLAIVIGGPLVWFRLTKPRHRRGLNR